MDLVLKSEWCFLFFSKKVVWSSNCSVFCSKLGETQLNLNILFQARFVSFFIFYRQKVSMQGKRIYISVSFFKLWLCNALTHISELITQRKVLSQKLEFSLRGRPPSLQIYYNINTCFFHVLSRTFYYEDSPYSFSQAVDIHLFWDKDFPAPLQCLEFDLLQSGYS